MFRFGTLSFIHTKAGKYNAVRATPQVFISSFLFYVERGKALEFLFSGGSGDRGAVFRSLRLIIHRAEGVQSKNRAAHGKSEVKIMSENFVYVQVIGVILRFFLASAATYLGNVGVTEELQDSLVDEMVNYSVPVILAAVALGWSVAQKRFSNYMIRVAKEAHPAVPLERIAEIASEKAAFTTKI